MIPPVQFEFQIELKEAGYDNDNKAKVMHTALL